MREATYKHERKDTSVPLDLVMSAFVRFHISLRISPFHDEANLKNERKDTKSASKLSLASVPLDLVMSAFVRFYISLRISPFHDEAILKNES